MTKEKFEESTDSSEEEKKKKEKKEEKKEEKEEKEEKKETREDFEDSMESFEDSSDKSLVLFYAPWCPHCKSMMGDWNRLQRRSMRGYRVVKVNCDEKPEMAEKYSVKGFPTIILFKNGRRVHFEGPRNYDNFVKFLKEN
jgi:protein disulfide-isomerase-like protein